MRRLCGRTCCRDPAAPGDGGGASWRGGGPFHPPPPPPRARGPAPAIPAPAPGPLRTNKGFDVLSAAWEALPPAHLWLPGEGPERAALTALGPRRGPRLPFGGWGDDVPGLMAAADVLVCPPRHEPLGNVVM